MHIEDPNDTPEPTLDEALSTALDEGIAEATPAGEPPAEQPEGEQQEPDATDGKAEEGTPKDGKPEGDKPAEGKPEDDAAKEADTLGLKGKANERFVAMANEIKTLAPLKAALEQAGIKDVAELPTLVKHAKDGADLVEMVKGTGASPDQFGQTLDYLALVTKAGAGDRQAAEQAFAVIESEYQALAKVLGKEVPGVHDPLAEYPDLQKDVEGGDVTRERALEIAQARTAAKVQQEARARQQQTTEQTTAQQRAIDEGRAALNALEAKLQADPHYAAKKPALIAKLGEIRQKFAPDQWAYAAELAYAAIPNPQPAKPPPSAIRPGGPRPAMAPAVFENPEDALEAGIAAASAG